MKLVFQLCLILIQLLAVLGELDIHTCFNFCYASTRNIGIKPTYTSFVRCRNDNKKLLHLCKKIAVDYDAKRIQALREEERQKDIDWQNVLTELDGIKEDNTFKEFMDEVDRYFIRKIDCDDECNGETKVKVTNCDDDQTILFDDDDEDEL